MPRVSGKSGTRSNDSGGPTPSKTTSRKRVLRSDSVFEHLVNLIKRGRLKPGDRLPSEQELMILLNVGRSSVREAVRSLAIAGVLETKQRRGTVVVSRHVDLFKQRIERSVAHWAIKDLEEVRMLLEGHAARQAAKLATPEQLAEIARWQTKLEIKARAGGSYFKENSRFHLAIARASHNSALVFCLASVIDSFEEGRELLSLRGSQPKDDIADHNGILAAIRIGDAERACTLMQAHVARNIEVLSAVSSS